MSTLSSAFLVTVNKQEAVDLQENAACFQQRYRVLRS